MAANFASPETVEDVKIFYCSGQNSCRKSLRVRQKEDKKEIKMHMAINFSSRMVNQTEGRESKVKTTISNFKIFIILCKSFDIAAKL